MDRDSPTTIQRFGADLVALLDRYKADGLRHEIAIRTSRIDEEPEPDPSTGIRWSRHRLGPVAEVTPTLVDTGNPDDLMARYFEATAAVRAFIDLSRSEGG